MSLETAQKRAYTAIWTLRHWDSAISWSVTKKDNLLSSALRVEEQMLK